MVLKTTTTSETSKPDSPQIIIENVGQTLEYVNGIELTFDSYFSLYGTCEIYIAGRQILKDNEAGDFKQYKVFSVPIDIKELKQGELIEIYVWNEKTSDEVILSVNVDIADLSRASILNGQAIDSKSILSEISGGAGDDDDTNDIFPYAIYKDTVEEFLINTKGRHNLLLTMAASSITPPEIIENTIDYDDLSLALEQEFTDDSTADETSTTETDSNTVWTDSYYWSSLKTRVYVHHYTITEYYYALYGEPTIPTMETEYGESVVIDGMNTDAKIIEFDFTASEWSMDVTYSFRLLEKIMQEYARMSGTHAGSSNGNSENSVSYSSDYSSWFTSSYTYTAIFSELSATHDGNYNTFSYSPSATYYYKNPYIIASYDIHYEVHASDDSSFATYDVLSNITSNGSKSFATSKQYLRIRPVIVPVSQTYFAGTDSTSSSSLSNSTIITQSYPEPTVATISNFIDTLSAGGTASVELQLKGINDVWFTILDSTTLGAVTQGDQILIQYDIEGLPASQSRLKAVMTVVDSLQTGVSIDIV